MKKPEIPQLFVGAAIVLIIVTGLIHFADAPDNFTEVAYKGVLFIANGIAAIVAAWGIYRHEHWGWVLGALVAGGAFVMYIISRTIGLPVIGVDDAWFEPMGVVAMLVEGAFVVLAAISLTRYNLVKMQPVIGS
jgi:hypothetical protein